MIRSKSALRISGLGVFSFVCLTLTACLPVEQAANDQSELSLLKPCPSFSESGEVAAVANAECGTLSVLENPADTEGRTIELNIRRLPAIRAIPAEDPLFILVGGPGQAATEFSTYVAPLFNDVRKKRDIILLDQRGTGRSNPLDCERDETDNWTLSDEQEQAEGIELLKACLDTYDADLRFYTTPYAMDDLDQVRRALGYQHINLWGVSYGTRAALVYARLYPESVRTIILDATAPVEMMIPHSMEIDADNALLALENHCQNNPSCVDSLGSLKENFIRVTEQLSQQPATVSVAHPVTQESTEILVTAKRFAGFVRMALYSRELGPLIPLAVKQAAQDNYQLFLSIVLMAAGGMEEGISQGMHLAVLCNEDLELLRQTRANGELGLASSEMFKTGALEFMQNACQWIPTAEIDAAYFEPVASSVPTLILSGEVDPATPPRWGETVFKSLSNAKHLIAQGGHHGISGLGCVPDLMATFIDEGGHEQLDTACIDMIKIPSAFVDVMGPDMQGIPAKKAQGVDTHD